MGNEGIDRRRFLLSGLATVSGLALGHECYLSPTSFEGIYTDRFTYRQGQWILVACSLQNPQTVQLELVALHSSTPEHISFHAAQPPNHGNDVEAGVLGARFQYEAAIDSTNLEPGYYEILIPAAHLLPENQTNTYHNYVSQNTVARFVVTAASVGSHSRLLWVHDSLSGTCYGSFGGQSIYGPQGVEVRTVSMARPGLDRATSFVAALRFLRDNGFEFEYADLVELASMPAADLAAYDLVVCIGKFEYLPNEVMEALTDFVDTGGNLFVAANEFGIFRARLDPTYRQLTTYKYDFESLDPLYGTGSPLLAGVGMNAPDGVLETELIGQHLWAAHRVTPGFFIDMPLYPTAETDWILADTGLGAGDVLPEAFKNFGTGQRLDLASGSPVIVDAATTGTYAGTQIWAAVPSADGRAWWQANGQSVQNWPLLSDGYATASYQERPSGGRIVTLPSANTVNDKLNQPARQQLLLNIVEGLS